MRVGLIKPSNSGILGLEMLTFVEPLGLECLAGCLEPAGHPCRIVDMRIDGMDVGMSKIEAFAPDIVGLQSNFTTERNVTLATAAQVRRRLPGATIVIGGHDASRDPHYYLSDDVDIVATGDGEEVMPLLVEALATGGDLKSVLGLELNTPDGPFNTGEAPMRDNIDELPLPARHLIDEYADKYYINFRKPLALLETARGCPFKCNFCSVWKFHKSTFREKSVERVIEELHTIKADNVFITDDIFWLDVHRGRALATAIKAAGIKKYFTVQTRTDIICKFPDLIKQWKECGDLAIFLGVEKVDDAGLKSVNKGNSASNNRRAIEILQELGVGYTCNFIVDPAWERDDFTRLRDWIEEMGTYNSGFTILTPLPGTDLWSTAKNDVTTNQWEMFDLLHTVLPTRLPLADFYDEFSRLWRWLMEVRFKHRSKTMFYAKLAAAVATRKVTFKSLRKGMNLASAFSKPDAFLNRHRELGEAHLTAVTPGLGDAIDRPEPVGHLVGGPDEPCETAAEA